MVVSSAKRQIFVPVLIPELISLINRRNSKGPNIDPCGTPELTGKGSEKILHYIVHTILYSVYYAVYNYTEIIDIISKLDDRKSNDISPKLLKALSGSFSNVLSYLMYVIRSISRSAQNSQGYPTPQVRK